MRRVAPNRGISQQSPLDSPHSLGVTAMLLLLMLAGLAGAQVPPPDRNEPEPVTVLEQYGPVIDRAEAESLGLFRYRSDFGALRVVRAGPDRYEARLATSRRGVLVEQPVPLDSLMLARLRDGLLLLRDRGPTGVELLLSPGCGLDETGLGPASDARSLAAAGCFGLLGLGAGFVTGTALTFDRQRSELGWPDWRRENFGTTAVLSAATSLLGAWCGWYLGARADAARPAQPEPRCAIAGYDDSGFPFYEEDVRMILRGASTAPWTGAGIVLGLFVARLAGGIVANAFRGMTESNDPNGIGVLGEPVLDIGVIMVLSYVANTIGRDMDRETALERLRHRPRP